MQTKKAYPDLTLRGKEIVIPRKFRWTLESLDHPGITQWVKYVNLDMFKRRLNIKVIETQDLSVLRWVQGLGRTNKKAVNTTCDVLTLNTYDGAGDVIFRLVFKRLKCKSHTCPFDYTNSEDLDHNIILSFDSIEMHPRQTLHPDTEQSPA